MSTRTYTLADFDFELPPELIAQHPAAERSASRLLDGRGAHAGRPRVPRTARSAARRRPAGLQRHARHQGAAVRRKGQRRRGRRRWSSACCPATRCWPTCAPASRPRPGSVRALCRRLRCRGAGPRRARRGAVPPALPGRSASCCCRPTAMCRCRPTSPMTTRPRTRRATRPCLPRARARWPRRPRRCTSTRRCSQALQRRAACGRAAVTLHVGAGTFQPVRTENLAEHRMHSEWFEVGAATVQAIEATRAAGGRVVAVGTTTLRALESAARDGALRAGAARPTSSSRRASSSASSTSWSPTSTCRRARC